MEKVYTGRREGEVECPVNATVDLLLFDNQSVRGLSSKTYQLIVNIVNSSCFLMSQNKV